MSFDLKHTQDDARRSGRLARSRLSDEEREYASEIIAEKVVRAAWFQRAKRIACYLPAPDEVNTWTIIARAWRMKKRIFAPVVKKNSKMLFQEITPDTDLWLNQFGIREPTEGETVAARTLDVVVTPVVAFDSSNNRVGMGGGYFDRSFSFLKHRNLLFHPRLIGVAFDCQKVEQITSNPWDIRLFSTITESETTP
jgi:5-formyltetrahydrofolate cyclo-ligase